MIKYTVRVINWEGEDREYEFDNEERAIHEFVWYTNFTTAERVELVANK